MSTLPEGWARVLIDDISVLVTSGSRDWSKFYSDRGAYFIRSAEINDYHLRLSEAIHVELPERIEGKRALVEKGDVLVTITGANVGKCAKVDADIPESYVSQSMALIKLSSKELAPIVYYGLRAPKFGAEQLADSAYGVGRPVLSLPLIKAVELPIPPENEQRRMVAKLEALLPRVNACRERLDKIPKLLARFRQSVLTAACSGRLTADWRTDGRAHFVTLEGPTDGIPGTWKQSTLRKLAVSITDGDHQPPPKSVSGVPFVVISNLKLGQVDLSSTMHVPVEYYESLSETRKPRRGDILYTVTGSYGRVAVIRTDRQFCFQRHIALIRPGPLTNTEYLHVALSSQETLKQATAAATGTAQLTVPLRAVRTLVIPEPPLPEQQEIVRRVDQLFAFADRLEARVETARKRVDALTQSILAKAFRGELVPTEAELAEAENRTFESAAELLERIRSLNPQGKSSATNKTQQKRARKVSAAKAATA